MPHHVTQRGVRSLDIFESDEDREIYLRCMAESAGKHGVRFWAWCLMSNHVHLVAVPKRAGSLAKAIGEAHWRYTRHVNFRAGVRGRRFQGRFESCPVQRNAHLIAVMRYVELNPVKAGMVCTAEAWPWSSARYNLGTRNCDALVQERMADALDVGWREILQQGEEEVERARIARHLGTGRPLGDETWVRGLEKELGRQLRSGKSGWPKGKPRKSGEGRSPVE